MKHQPKITLILALCTLLSMPAQAEETDEQGILPKVDKPIPDTYQPLDGADWNHRTSDELRELREYQKQTQDKAEAERQLQLREELEAKIQAPDPGKTTPPADPEIREDANSLRIGDTE